MLDGGRRSGGVNAKDVSKKIIVNCHKIIKHLIIIVQKGQVRGATVAAAGETIQCTTMKLLSNCMLCLCHIASS